jgi:hypothetical protein
MKHFFLMLCLVLVAGLGLTACDALGVAAPTPTLAPIIATIAPTAAPTAEVPPSPTVEPPPAPTAEPTAVPVSGAAVSFDRLNLVAPAGVATGGTGAQVAEVAGENAGPWDIAPAHFQLTLDGYALQGQLLQPRIYVYPADAYAQVRPAAAQSLERLRAVLARPAGAPLTKEELPMVPFFNATQIIATNVKVIPFQNGQGVRVVTQYAQGLVPINNHEVIYHFEGLTSDGKYYVIAVLPVNVPSLAADNNPNTAVPAGGVPLPDLTGANPDMAGYYKQVQQMLDGLQPAAYTPNLDQLDALIQSISITTNN